MSDNFVELKPFRFWCQKVLPLTYDESLSYYELLCKCVDYINKCIEDLNLLNEDVSELKLAMTALTEYVHNYFSSLDVQREINKALDKLAGNGFFDRLTANTVKKHEANSVSMDMLTQDIKDAMTGSSTPVVGDSSVYTDSIVDKAVDMYKLKHAMSDRSIKTNHMEKGYYSTSYEKLVFSEYSANRMIAIPVEYGEMYTIFRTIIDSYYEIVEIHGEFENDEPAYYVYNLETNGYRGYYYTPTNNHVTMIVITFHGASTSWTVQECFDALYVLKGIYDYNWYYWGDTTRSYRYTRPLGYNINLTDVMYNEKQGWAEGVLGAGETFKLAEPMDLIEIPSSLNGNVDISLSGMTYQQLLSIYNSISGISKEIIGYATADSEILQPDSNYPIWVYKLRTQAGNVRCRWENFEPMKILITSGVHGEEKGAPYCLAMLTKMMCNQNLNSLLREAYSNINIDIIPAVNPWGFSHQERYNQRGVDLNRNFSYHWTSGEHYGESALSELESQSVALYIEDHPYDYIIDWHEAEMQNGTYVATENRDLAAIHIHNCRKMYTSIFTRYNQYVINGDQGVAEYNTIASLANQMYATDNINNGVIFEQAWGPDEAKWRSRLLSVGFEMFANYLIELTRRFSNVY